MSRNALIFSLLFACLTHHVTRAQTTGIDIVGVWKGTSICQVKNTPCHDENVVYRVSKGESQDAFDISASKIVDGKEEEMGIIPFKFNKATNQLTASFHGLWVLNVTDHVMDGTLTQNGTLFRIVKLSRTN